MTRVTTGRVGLLGPTRLSRYMAASLVGLQMLVAVIAGGSVIGSFLIPETSTAAPAVRELTPELINAGAPMALLMPDLKVEAPVVPIAMLDKTLDPPRDYHEVGWWNASAKPGSPQGQTVITGHTLHTGGASMNKLGSLEPDDEVALVSKRGTLTYVVTKTEVLTKRELAKRSAELFAQDRGEGRLVLITCSNWDGSSYQTNTIVYATPVGEFVPSTTI